MTIFLKLQFWLAIIALVGIVCKREVSCDADFDLYKDANYNAYWGSQRYQIGDSECLNFNFWKNKVSSVNTHGTCVRLWSNEHCTGTSLQLGPGSENYCNSNLALCWLEYNRVNWNNQANSISGCDFGEFPDAPLPPYIISTEGREPFQSNFDLKIWEGNENGLVNIQLPTKLQLTCNDTSWGSTRIRTIPKDVKHSAICLKIFWGPWDGSSNGEGNEVWQISGAKGCSVSPSTVNIRNCWAVGEERAPSGSIFGKITNLDRIPDAYSLDDINPTLELYGKEPGFIKSILLKDAWRKPLFMLDDISNEISTVLVICPDFMERNNETWMMNLKDYLIQEMPNAMVITVGWENGGNLWFWRSTTAVANSQVVGEYLSSLLKQLKLEMPEILLWGIGKGLGAHILGRAGRESVGLIDRITGLDPSGPSFDTVYKNQALTKTDAKFVDVIHSDGLWGGLITKPEEDEHEKANRGLQNVVGRYGTMRPSGHQDFYLNWGFDQPLPENFKFVQDPFGNANHQRALELFSWSIKNPNRLLSSGKIAGVPSSKNPHEKTAKMKEYPVELGFHASPTIEGNFYLETGFKKPWVEAPEPERKLKSFCKSSSVPRLITERTTGLGEVKKLNILFYSPSSEDENWVEAYSIYWDQRKMSPLMTVQQITFQQEVGESMKEEENFQDLLCSQEIIAEVGNGGEEEEEDVPALPFNMFAGLIPEVDSAFKKDVQTESFKNQSEGIFPDATNHFEKGQLVPIENFPTTQKNQRKATLLYLNVVPLWTSMKNGNWKKLNEYLGEVSQPNSTVYTIPLGQLVGGNGNPVYMSRLQGDSTWNRIPVPSKIAKVVIGSLHGGDDGDEDEKACVNSYIIGNHPREMTSTSSVNKLSELCGEKLSETIVEGEESGRIECFRNIPSQVLEATKKIDFGIYLLFKNLTSQVSARSCF